MKFRDFFDINELFSPSAYYTGDFLLDISETDGFILNAKQKNGQNAYFNFLEKYYYKPIASLINSVSLARISPPFIEIGIDQNNKRVTTFSLFKFVFNVMRGFCDPSKSLDKLFSLNSGYNNEDLLKLLREELMLERRKYSDVKANGKKSEYYESVYEVFTLSEYDKGFLSFLENLISSHTKLIVGTKYFLDFFNKTIKTEELVDCFDYDKFCLLAARFVLDNALMVEQREGLIHNSVQFIKHYLYAVENYRKHVSSYNCGVVSNDYMTGKRKVYTIDDIEKEYNALLARHPEHRFINMSMDRIIELLKTFGYDDDFIDNFDISTTDIKELTKVLNIINDSKSLLASWKIIPKGKWEDTETFSEPSYSPNTVEEAEAIRRMLISKEFFANSNYLFRI